MQVVCFACGHTGLNNLQTAVILRSTDRIEGQCHGMRCIHVLPQNLPTCAFKMLYGTSNAYLELSVIQDCSSYNWIRRYTA